MIMYLYIRGPMHVYRMEAIKCRNTRNFLFQRQIEWLCRSITLRFELVVKLHLTKLFA